MTSHARINKSHDQHDGSAETLPPGTKPKRAGSRVRRSGAAGLTAPPRVEVVEQLRETAEKLSKIPQHGGSHVVDCIQAAAQDRILKHADREARLWAAKCLIEGLRIFAPKPPLPADRLAATLELFLEQLNLLVEPGSAGFVQAFGLLEKINEVHAFMLLYDCADPEKLIAAVVKVCLTISRSHTEGHLESLLVQLLSSILREADAIPRAVLADLIQELAPRQQESVVNFARRVFADLATHSTALFINEFLTAALYSESPLGDESPCSEAARQRIARLFDAVYELFSVDLALVVRVLPHLQADLQCGDAWRRRAVTTLVGRMLAHIAPTGSPASSTAPMRPPLSTTHPLLLDRHLERLGDADDEVRLAALGSVSSLFVTCMAPGGSFTEAEWSSGGPASTSIMSAMAQVGRVLRAKLLERCLDPCDAVRLRVIEITAEVAGSDEGVKLLAPVLPEVFRRILDRRPRIREACAVTAAALYGRHALPAWSAGHVDSPSLLTWIPQLLCEAYGVFANGHVGHTGLLEELIEQHVIGCGAKMTAKQRALALVGFVASASGEEKAAQGLALLLGRKRDAHAALRRFLKLRLDKGGPIMEPDAPGVALVLQGNDEHVAQRAGRAVEAQTTLENLGRLSPTAEDRNSRPGALILNLRAMDAVRDRALWQQIDRLSNPQISTATADMEPTLGELDRLLRVHRLSELAPLLRRALLSTWMLPDRVPTMLECWGEGRLRPPLSCQARLAVAELPRYFPGAFLKHADLLAEHLSDIDLDDVRAALRAIASLGKRASAVVQGSGGTIAARDVTATGQIKMSTQQLLEMLLSAARLLSEDVASSSSACRKVARALTLLPGGEAMEALQQALQWAAKPSAPQAVALHLAAACLEQLSRGLAGATTQGLEALREQWQARAVSFVMPEKLASTHPGPMNSDQLYAAAELCVATGTEQDILRVLAGAAQLHVGLPLHASVCVLHALRRGVVSLTTQLLSHLASQLSSALASELTFTKEVDTVIGALKRLLRHAGPNLGLANKLRLAATLPTVFALIPTKQQKDEMQRLLQAALLKAMQQCVMRQEPLVDFAVACFLHFLSRLDVLRAEAAAPASAFPESTKVAAFFCEALLKADPVQQRTAELTGVVLRVCDSVRFFADKEDPTSDAVNKAAHVLRYVIERGSYPNSTTGSAAGSKGTPPPTLLPPSSSRNSMPAQLFTLRPDFVSKGHSNHKSGRQRELPAPTPERPSPWHVHGGTSAALLNQSPAESKQALVRGKATSGAVVSEAQEEAIAAKREPCSARGIKQELSSTGGFKQEACSISRLKDECFSTRSSSDERSAKQRRVARPA